MKEKPSQDMNGKKIPYTFLRQPVESTVKVQHQTQR